MSSPSDATSRHARAAALRRRRRVLGAVILGRPLSADDRPYVLSRAREAAALLPLLALQGLAFAVMGRTSAHALVPVGPVDALFLGVMVLAAVVHLAGLACAVRIWLWTRGVAG
ncbi:MAG TPA: hypothetical protein VK402_16960 [Blastococcus sp.]|nr:hypothetical protein [Blastococcus sp.]